MSAMHILRKTGTVYLRVADPRFIFDRISVRTIQTHMCRLLLAYLSLALKKILSLCNIPLLPPLLSEGDM